MVLWPQAVYRQLRRLRRIGIEPHPDAITSHALHAAWRPSVLHWSVLSAFWPGKLAAFEARQLRHVLEHNMPAPLGVDPHSCYHQAQAQAQNIAAANIIPAYPQSAGAINIQFTETNPDRDVCPTGHCFLACTSSDQVSIYDSAGAWVMSVSQSCIASLANMLSPGALRLSSFATAIRGILHRPIQDIKRLSSTDLFKQQFGLPDPLMASLQSMLQIKFEWFASAWNRHCLPMHH